MSTTRTHKRSITPADPQHMRNWLSEIERTELNNNGIQLHITKDAKGWPSAIQYYTTSGSAITISLNIYHSSDLGGLRINEIKPHISIVLEDKLEGESDGPIVMPMITWVHAHQSGYETSNWIKRMIWNAEARPKQVLNEVLDAAMRNLRQGGRYYENETAIERMQLLRALLR